MKRNYLKPLCSAAPMDGLELMQGSLRIDKTNVVTNSVDAGWAREMEPVEGPSQNSVWDD